MKKHSMTKWQHSFDILKILSLSDTRQNIKRRIATEKLTEIYSQVRLHEIGCVYLTPRVAKYRELDIIKQLFIENGYSTDVLFSCIRKRLVQRSAQCT